jgi:hypothetical protein
MNLKEALQEFYRSVNLFIRHQVLCKLSEVVRYRAEISLLQPGRGEGYQFGCELRRHTQTSADEIRLDGGVLCPHFLNDAQDELRGPISHPG